MASIQSLSPRRHRIRWREAWDPAKARYPQRCAIFEGTRKQAEKERDRIAVEREGKAPSPAPSEAAPLTVGAFLDRWLETSVRIAVRRSTYRSYRWAANLIKDGLGNLLLRDLSARDVQSFLADLMARPARDRGGRDTEKMLSAGSVRGIHQVLKGALETAVDWGEAPANAARRAKGPRMEKPRHQIAPVEDIARVIASIPDRNVQVGALIAIGTGLRRGEVCGLRWGDIDLREGRITSRLQIGTGEGGALVAIPHKAGDGRTVRIPAFLTAVLAEHCRYQEAALLNPVALPFAARWALSLPDGSAFSPWRLTVYLARAARAAGVPGLHFHSLRHLQATLLIDAGIPARIVSDRLGHSDVEITLRTYYHPSALAQEAAVDAVEGELGRWFRNGAGESAGGVPRALPRAVGEG